MDQDVVRRFELWVDGSHGSEATRRAMRTALGAVGEAVATVNQDFEGLPRAVSVDVGPVTRSPIVDVRLEGPAAAVAEVMKNLPPLRIRGDVTRVPRVRRAVAASRDARSRAPVTQTAPAAASGTPVTVAIVDSGLMVEHPAFAGHVWTGPDGTNGRRFIDGLPADDLRDQEGHGTLVAGSVLDAARDAPVSLLVAKFFDAENPARPDNAAAALRFATSQGAKVIVCAWDVGIGSIALEDAFAEACASSLVVIAAGNYGSDNDWCDGRSLARAPVRYAPQHPDTTIVVMATDRDGQKAWFSNYGVKTVDIAAKGTGIRSTRRSVSNDAAAGPSFRRHAGTSPAAAEVAGAAALLLARYPTLGAAQVKHCLVHSVDVMPGLKCASGGVLDVDAALICAAQQVAGT